MGKLMLNDINYTGGGGQGAAIDDNTISTDTTWSSSKIDNTKVSKSGDHMTGSLIMDGKDIVLSTNGEDSNDSGDITWTYGNGQEKARIWTQDNPTTAGEGRLSFRAYKEDGTSLYTGRLATSGDVDGKVSKTGDTMTGSLKIETNNGAGLLFKETGYGDKFEIVPSFSGTDDTNYLAIRTAVGAAGTDPSTSAKLKIYPSGTLQVVGDRGGSWVSAKDVHQASIEVEGTATAGTRYDSIISMKANNGGVITLGRISNEFDIGYIEAGQTANNLKKMVSFQPVNGNGKLVFGTDGASKSYIDLNDGSFSGKAANSTLWNGYTNDIGTNNTTDTWVPVVASNATIQHRVLSSTLNNKTVKDATAVHSLGYSSNDIPTTQFMAYWNGAYNASGNSNLQYCDRGRLGTVVTKGVTNATNYSTSTYPQQGERVLQFDSSAANITPSHMRTKWLTWSANIAIDCNPASTMLGMVLVSAGTNTQLIRIYCSGNPSTWGVHSMTGADLCSWGASQVTIGGQKCQRLTIQMKSGSGTFFAIYGVSDPNHY